MSSGRCVTAVLVALLSQACATTVVLHERDPLEVTARRPSAPPPPEQPAPPPPVVQLERNRIRVDEKIQFALNSADILAESHGLLDQIAQVINEHPEVGAIRVEGHTSSEGSRAHNQRLSQRRAQSVVAYLVGKNVPRERLQPQGFGPDRPLDGASLEQNRRVEFNFINPPAEGAAAPAEQGSGSAPPAAQGPPASPAGGGQ